MAITYECCVAAHRAQDCTEGGEFCNKGVQEYADADRIERVDRSGDWVRTASELTLAQEKASVVIA
jgi:hypothetical protein